MVKLKDLPIIDRKIIRAWCVYDWANSGFATSGIAAIFPVYFVFLFKDAIGEEASFWGITFTGSSMWSLAIAGSTAIVALSSPVLGIITDRVAIKKTLLWVYTIAGSLFTGLAFFSAYTSHPWAWLLGTFILGNIGFAGSLVFYNSFLPHITPRELLDDVSSRGFAYGYVGGGLLLLIHLALNLITEGTSISDLVTRGSIASIGLWWFAWALWTFKVLPEPPLHNAIEGLGPAKAGSLAIKELGRTFRQITKFKVILIYLGAYLLFNDGIQTVLGIAGAFAADTIGIPLAFNMGTILIIQFVAAPGSMMFSWIAGSINTKEALRISLAGWSLIVLLGVAIVPLIPTRHSEFDYRISYQTDSAKYVVDGAPELGTSSIDVLWNQEAGLVKVEQSLTASDVKKLIASVHLSENSRYSISIEDGPLGGSNAVGPLHNSTLGSGPVDWWPEAIRELLWRPLDIAAGYQWLILGLFVGLVMGGSQALSRSLFAQITPETRSGEFFSFFGFMSRASSVFGPMIYVFVTGMFDTRMAVTSILLIIVAGTVALHWVNVSEGSRVAAAEDNRRRKEFA
ncbi:MAG: MFS transporter [SAR202 cluster bacterium]|nr:MFS transporter [SAR202 cluster bacterium]